MPLFPIIMSFSVEGYRSTQVSGLWFSMYMISIVKPMVINSQHNLPGVSSVSLLLVPKITTTAPHSNDADGLA